MENIKDFLKTKRVDEMNWTSSVSAGYTGADVEPSYDYVSVGLGRSPKAEKVDIEKVAKSAKGKRSTSNGSKGKWGFEEPTPKDKENFSDRSKWNSNIEDLMMKFDAEEPFFVKGKAGWAKTSIIKQIAKKYGYKVITVYLDKIMASDLGGIPVPVEDDVAGALQEMAMPAWAAPLLAYPKDKFLLFFDEFNQAPGDVQNALMPIILESTICGIKFNNFFVGAAGNLEEENRSGITSLSDPLVSRFAPIIEWKSNDDPTWDTAIEHQREVWAGKIDLSLIEKINECRDIFMNPRDVELKIIKWVYELVKKGVGDKYPASAIQRRIYPLLRKDIDRSERTKADELSEWIANFISNNGEALEETSGRKIGKDRETMIDEETMMFIRQAVQSGFVLDNGVKYGISEENFSESISEIASAEQSQRLIKKFKIDGINFKFKTNAEFKKAGYKEFK